MLPKLTFNTNGQEVAMGDIHTLANAANADDAVFDQLLKILPYTNSFGVSKVVMPRFPATVIPNGVGTIAVRPFAFAVGSRVASSDNISDNAFSATVGQFAKQVLATDSFGWNVTISANGAGGPRWDLIYASVVLNNPTTAVTRYYKDPNTKVIGPTSVSVTQTNDCTILYLPGTTSVDVQPAWPPDDIAHGIFIIPLAYVRVPAGFNPAVSSINAGAIAEIFPTRSVGAANCVPAQCTRADLISHASWFSSGTRTPLYFPTGMTGFESRFFPLDLGTASNMLLDNSIDWRNRMFQWQVCARAASSSPKFAWDVASAGSSAGVPPHAAQGTVLGVNSLSGMGSSFTDDSFAVTIAGTTPASVVIFLANSVLSEMANSCFIYVDSNGRLRLDTTGDIAAKLFIWITATGQFADWSIT